MTAFGLDNSEWGLAALLVLAGLIGYYSAALFNWLVFRRRR